MDGGRTYDKAVEIYDESRPSYPDKVIDWIIRNTGFSKKTFYSKLVQDPARQLQNLTSVVIGSTRQSRKVFKKIDRGFEN